MNQRYMNAITLSFDWNTYRMMESCEALAPAQGNTQQQMQAWMQQPMQQLM